MSSFSYISAPNGMPLGDVTIFDGRVTVFNEIEGLQQWFENPDTCTHNALWYIYTRMHRSPVFSNPTVFDTQTRRRVQKQLAKVDAL